MAIVTEHLQTGEPTEVPALRLNARVYTLTDGRVHIVATTTAEATKVAEAFQAMGVNVRQYGTGLILHPTGK